MDEQEEWRRLPGFDDSYEVSNLGRVRSYKSRNGRGSNLSVPRLLRLDHKDKDGYIHITLRDDGKDVDVRAHKLVMMAFDIHPTTNQDQICHGNGIKTDNRLCNLRWGTCLDNAKDRTTHGVHKKNIVRGKTHFYAKLNDEKVKAIRLEYTNNKTSQYVLANKYEVSQGAISHLLLGHTWKHVL